MTITLRSATQSGATTKGSELTYAELDGNFQAFMGSGGAANVGFLQSGTGAQTRNVQDRLRETVSVFDFMTSAQIADVQANGFSVDVTSAVQKALDATNTGGTVFFPAGTYKITSTLTISAGHTLIGVSRGVYSGITGSVLRGDSDNLKLLQLNVGSQGVRIENLMLWGSTTTYRTGTVAILMQGSSAASDASINGVLIVNCAFWRWEKAILAQDTATGSYQVSSVALRDCKLGESLYGVYLNSQNVSFWTLDNCTGSCAANGSCIYINKAGPLSIRGSTFSGADSTTTAMLTVNGSSAPIYLEDVQAESIKYFLLVNSGGQGAQVTMVICTVNGDISSATNVNLLFIMCAITNAVSVTSNARVADIFSQWTLSGALTLSASSLLLADIGSSQSGSTDQLVTRIESGLSTRRIVKTLSSNIAIDARLGTLFCITVTGSSAFTINNPTVEANSTPRITIQVQNTSGGAMGTITWDTKYKMSSWTNPANGFSRLIDFQYDGTNWIQVSVSSADVPN